MTLTAMLPKKKPSLKDRSLHEHDLLFCEMAATDPSTDWLCWGEHLLLRLADLELQGILRNSTLPR